jgi:hypothetical protein
MPNDGAAGTAALIAALLFLSTPVKAQERPGVSPPTSPVTAEQPVTVPFAPSRVLPQAQ